MKGKCKIPIRFWIGLMVFLTTYINYTTRVNMSISIVSMTYKSAKEIPECVRDEKKEKDNKTKELPDYGPRYKWDQDTQGMVLGSYFWGYVISSLPAGFIAEWAGPWHTVFWLEAASMVMNVASVWAAQGHYGALLACRFVIGLCAGPVYPALQCLIARWAPPAEKGIFVAALMGNTLGTLVTWPVVGAVTQEWGWDWGFHAVSVQIALFLVVYGVLTADSPADHRWITEEEKNFIIDSQGGTVSKKRAVPPYLSMMKSVPFWALQVLHFGNLWGLYVQLTGVPKFMSEVVGFDMKSSGGLSALPHLARLILGFVYGAVADVLKKKGFRAKYVRRVSVILSHIIPGALILIIAFIGCHWEPIVALLTISMGVNGAVVLTTLVNPQDLAPNFAGSIFGIISCIGGVTGFIVPQITGAFIKENNGVTEWGYNFILGGLMYIASGIFFIIFGSTEIQKWNQKKGEEVPPAETDAAK